MVFFVFGFKSYSGNVGEKRLCHKDPVNVSVEGELGEILRGNTNYNSQGGVLRLLSSYISARGSIS